MTETEQIEAAIDSAAAKIVSMGLQSPAIFLLEMNKPLSNLLFNGALLIEPLAGLFISRGGITNIKALFSEPQNIEKLINRIEALCGSGCGHVSKESAN